MPRLAAIAAYGFADLPTARLLRAFVGLGVRSLQFYRNEANPPTPAEALRLAADAGLGFDSIHGVFGPAYDPSSPDEPTRRAAVEAYRREGELALQLTGPAVVVHPSPPDTVDSTQRSDALRRTAAELAAMGEKLGVTYLLENLPGTFAAASPRIVAAVVREIASPHLRMCFDTGHAHMVGDIAADLREAADTISYLHIHDNDARKDDHRIPGDGSIPWDALRPAFAALGPAVPAMLELFQSPDDLTARAATGLPARLYRWLT